MVERQLDNNGNKMYKNNQINSELPRTIVKNIQNYSYYILPYQVMDRIFNSEHSKKVV